ncbi:MAG: hypothetical protein Q7U02_13685, partial [Desulfosalsimonadaceae bacterium]|nr:hypothetical protein [Desulfosalsimonadaceae bacterium]
RKRQILQALIMADACLLIFASTGFCLQPLNESEARSVVAASGISLAADDATIYLGSDSFRFTSCNNRNLFGNAIPEGYLHFDHPSILFNLQNAWCTLDIGTYHRPDETYRVADMAKASDDNHQWLQEGRTYENSGTLSTSPQYWTIPNPPTGTRPEPMDGQYGVIQASFSNLMNSFDLSTSLSLYGGSGSERTLSTLSMSGLHIPELSVGGVNTPGAQLTLYPSAGANINFELRTRLTIDNITLTNPLNAGSPDLLISGIHLGEAFFPAWTANPLPSHKGTTGTSSTIPDTSGWGNSFAPWVYGGYFLIGNLNQVNFDDHVDGSITYNGDSTTFADGRQIYNRSGNPGNPLYMNTDTGNIDIPVWIESNPMAINIGNRTSGHNVWDGYSYLSMTGGLHGSLRIESLEGRGTEFGPVAIDGIRIKYFKLELPGGYQREFFNPPAVDGGSSLGWHEKGRCIPQQEPWLDALLDATPANPTSTGPGTLQWLLTQP